MKHFFYAAIISISALIGAGMACSSKPKPVIYDPTIEMGQRTFLCDSALNVRDMELKASRDSARILKLRIDSINTKLFLETYRVEKVRYYIQICNQSPVKKKYFFGWIIRAVK